MKTRHITQAALVAAIYVALTLVFQPISFHVVQLRISEALTVLPMLSPAAVPGLFAGALIANALGSPFGLVDVALGSLLTLFAAILTRALRKWTFPALLSPVLVNALGVAAYLQFLTRMPVLRIGGASIPPYWAGALTIGAGEAAAVFALGYPLLVVLRRFGPQLFSEQDARQ